MSDSKGNFISGLVLGAIIAGVAFYALSNADLSNKAALVDTKNTDVLDNTDNNEDAEDIDMPMPTTTDINVTDADHIRGNVNAPITIVEYSDFQCPFSSSFHQTLLQVMTEYNNVRWVYRHFPLSFHAQAQKSAEASECAAEQGKFWEYSDLLYTNQADLANEPFSDLAEQLGLDKDRFDDCLSSGKYSSLVNDNFNQGIKDGVQGTPGGFINNKEIGGAVPIETLRAMIETTL